MDNSAKKPLRTDFRYTPDGRYIIVNDRLWRASNPDLDTHAAEDLVRRLMSARRSIAASSSDDELRSLRKVVHTVKVELGERGPVWWNDGDPDQNRKLVRNSSYADWYAQTIT